MSICVERYIFVNEAYLWHITGPADSIARSMGAYIDRVEVINSENEKVYLKVNPSQQTFEQFCETFATAVSRILELEGYTQKQYRAGWDEGTSLLQRRCRCLWHYKRSENIKEIKNGMA